MANKHRKPRHGGRVTRTTTSALGAGLVATFAVGFAVNNATGLPATRTAVADGTGTGTGTAALAASTADARPDRLARPAQQGSPDPTGGQPASPGGVGEGTTAQAKALGTAARPGAAAPAATPAQLVAEVTALLNAHRRTAGCAPVQAEARLRTAAQQHAADMAARRKLDTRSAGGEAPWEQAWAQGYYTYSGQTIGAGQAGARTVVDSWLRDKASRTVVLDCGSEDVGVAVRPGPGGPWWTAMFGYHTERR